MRLSAIVSATCLSIGGWSASTAAEGISRQPTSIAAQELAPALQILAKDRAVQLVYRSELVNDRRTNGATGVLTLEEALMQLLSGTGLVHRYLADDAITIVRQE